MNMRCFVGLDLPVQTKLALEDWRQRALPEVSSRDALPMPAAKAKTKARPNQPARPVAVPTANLHITLGFLGQINHRQHEAVMATLSEVQQEPFALTLDTTGVWSGPKILFCAPETPPAPLMDLARQVRKAARLAGIEMESREYRPHVTMIRKASVTLPPPLFTPQIEATFNQFHLFESVSSPQGVSYPIRHSWPLIPNLSVRERLKRGLA